MRIRVLPRHLLSVVLVCLAALLVVLVPKLAGTTWTAVVAVLLTVPLLTVLALGLV